MPEKLKPAISRGSNEWLLLKDLQISQKSSAMELFFF